MSPFAAILTQVACASWTAAAALAAMKIPLAPIPLAFGVLALVAARPRAKAPSARLSR
jgi:hypothetical protein